VIKRLKWGEGREKAPPLRVLLSVKALKNTWAEPLQSD